MAQMTRDEFNRAFGAVVKAIREARGLSQEEVDAGLRAIKTPEQEDEHLRCRGNQCCCHQYAGRAEIDRGAARRTKSGAG